MKSITVFTPTFNRAYCLGQVYESLKIQTSKDFIWLIVDDGSTDGTKTLVKSWKSENIIDIQYVWQENQGMHGAHNTAYDNIKTELNVCIDSDDYMPPNAIENILVYWKKFGNQNVAGIIGLDAHTDGSIVGTQLPDIQTSTLYNLYHKHGVSGDKKLVYRTELIKEHPYPIFKEEKYVGLDFKYMQIDKNFEMLLMNEVVCIVEYLPDGSSMNMYRQYKKNPKGWSFYRKEMMKLPFVNHTFKFRQAIHYVSSSLLSKNKSFMKEVPLKIHTILAFPFGLGLYVFIHFKTKQST